MVCQPYGGVNTVPLIDVHDLNPELDRNWDTHYIFCQKAPVKGPFKGFLVKKVVPEGLEKMNFWVKSLLKGTCEGMWS